MEWPLPLEEQPPSTRDRPVELAACPLHGAACNTLLNAGHEVVPAAAVPVSPEGSAEAEAGESNADTSPIVIHFSPSVIRACSELLVQALNTPDPSLCSAVA
mmetsp:Transcript_22222/g.48475  ORF Transcript_22222/g.48475 Transcript_22222/m.48475 type:complete len:102 (-) Transcript_22222:169-474(-)|eukprot:6193475-Pleurochrysis_carterae.AAC.5